MKTIIQFCFFCGAKFTILEHLAGKRLTCGDKECTKKHIGTPLWDRLFRMRDHYRATRDEIEPFIDTTSCDICGKDELESKLVVDHCHASGKVRGVLCYSCNTSLGKFKDSPELLRSAADYLEQ